MNLIIGVALALLGQALPNLDDAPNWQLEFEHRFGSIDDPETALTSIMSAAVAADETLVLAQLYDKRITVFDRAGKRIGSLGHPGNGPMDLGHPIAVGIRADTVWVIDNKAGSVKFFGLDGTWFGAVNFTESFGLDVLVKAGYPLENGDIVGNPRVAMRPLVDTEFRVPWIRFSRDGELIDTLAVDLRINQVGKMVAFGKGTTLFPQPLDQSDLVAVSPDATGLIHVMQRDLSAPGPVEIRKIGADGHEQFRQRYAVDAIRTVTDQIINQIVASNVELVKKVMGKSLGDFDSDAYRRVYREAITKPPAIPPISGLLVGSDGTIWVRRETAGNDSQRWIAINPQSGLPRGEIAFGSGKRFIIASDSYVWLEELDELNIVHLARYRIVGM